MKNWTKLLNMWVSCFQSWWQIWPELEIGLDGGYSSQAISLFREKGRNYLQTAGTSVIFNAPAFLATYYAARLDISQMLKSMLVALQESKEKCCVAFGFLGDDGQFKIAGSFKSQATDEAQTITLTVTVEAGLERISFRSVLTEADVAQLEKYLELESNRKTVRL